MAYTRTTMSGNVGPGAQAPTLYTYKTEDTMAEVAGAGYFNEGSDILQVHDIILAQCSNGLSIGHVTAISEAGVVGFNSQYTEQ